MAQVKMVPGAEPPREKLIPAKDDKGVWRLGPIRHRSWSGAYPRSSGNGATRKECMDDFWANFEANRNKGSNRTRSAATTSNLTLQSPMSAAFDTFLDRTDERVKKGLLKPRTRDSYRDNIRPGSDPDHHSYRARAIRLYAEMGNLSIAEASQPKFLSAYLADVHAEYPGVATVQGKILSGVFAMLTDPEQLFDTSPMKLVRLPKTGGAGNQRALEPAERVMLRECMAKQFSKPGCAQWPYYLVMLLLGTGMRPGEALALRWCDIYDLDGERPVVYVGAHIDKVNGKPVRVPGRKAHDSAYHIALPGWVAALLREWRGVCSPAADEELLFRSRRRHKVHTGVMYTSNVDVMMADRLADSPIDWVRPGNLRDTVATEVTGRTADPARASAQLGHVGKMAAATRSYIDRRGMHLYVVDNADVLEHLNPQSDIKMTIAASGQFISALRAAAMA